MNQRKEKTIITIENYRRTTLWSRRGAAAVKTWCQQCAAETFLISPNEAASHLQTTVREIFRRVEAENVHYVEIESGVILVCSQSLKEFKVNEN